MGRKEIPVKAEGEEKDRQQLWKDNGNEQYRAN